MARQPWHRQKGETAKAYAAFCAYYKMPIHERGLDAAWCAKNPQANSSQANGVWTNWSTKNGWVSRSAAYDEHLAEQDRILWEERRAILRQRDWDQADELRAVVSDAIPHAQQFIRSKRRFIPATDDSPEREVVTMQFDITGLSRVLTDASKLQRLATDLSTENIELSGAALDAVIARELAQLADGGETIDVDPFAEDVGEQASGEPADGAPEGGDTKMPE